MTTINLIVACAKNRVIGLNGAMPWHIPQELAHFKRLTMGCPVIMGRKTWDSIVHSLGKPLPGRTSIVLSQNLQWSAQGATAVPSIAAAIECCGKDDLVWVIGGASIYQQALPWVAQCHITEIDASFDGDAFFPALDVHQWLETSRIHHASHETQPLSFDTVVYQRIQPLKTLA